LEGGDFGGDAFVGLKGGFRGRFGFESGGFGGGFVGELGSL
jgi:hypothetical protein